MRLGLAIACFWIAAPAWSAAQSERLVEFRFTPTDRAQIAIWIENAEGTFMGTVRLTEAVALRGIGNRPGALQMNSGFRWPYGRREGVLPVWAHRRAQAPEAGQFPRVIFQDRISEGFASRTSTDASRDDYFCLSFDRATTTRDALDAVTCASVFHSDKGRFTTQGDVAAQYAEPFENPADTMRPLNRVSLYPPRRDVGSLGPDDHPDVGSFAVEARRVMPDIDAITMATPQGDAPQTVQFTVPPQWPSGEYTAWIEVNTEGDYNDAFNDSVYPTPQSAMWDSWAQTYGYPYRGQPSVLYSVPVTLGFSPDEQATATPVGRGALEGEHGNVSTTGTAITDDPAQAPGSGADRLRHGLSNRRFSANVLATRVCDALEPPPQCFENCSDNDPCDEGFICGTERTCVGLCDLFVPPDPPSHFTLDNHPDQKLSHRVAKLRFEIPHSRRALRSYIIRSINGPMNAETFSEAEPAKRPATNEAGDMLATPGTALQIPTDADCQGAAADSILCVPYRANASSLCDSGEDHDLDGDCLDPGDVIDVDIAFSVHEQSYEVGIQAQDECQAKSALTTASVTTTEIHFTQVDACFVATAAFGSPVADEIIVLRRFRDQVLMRSWAGRAFVRGYYHVGPRAADIIRHRPWLRSLTRTLLKPFIALARFALSS